RPGTGRRARHGRGRDPAGGARRRQRLVARLWRAHTRFAVDPREGVAGHASQEREKVMEFKINAVLPSAAEKLWEIFFDVSRVAGLIPGVENVVEVEPMSSYTATMKQKIGPFKFEVPTQIAVEELEQPRLVKVRAK